MKNQRKMAHFVGISTFIDKKYQLYGIKELVISKKFLKANLFLIKQFLSDKFDCTFVS